LITYEHWAEPIFVLDVENGTHLIPLVGSNNQKFGFMAHLEIGGAIKSIWISRLLIQHGVFGAGGFGYRYPA